MSEPVIDKYQVFAAGVRGRYADYKERAKIMGVTTVPKYVLVQAGLYDPLFEGFVSFDGKRYRQVVRDYRQGKFEPDTVENMVEGLIDDIDKVRDAAASLKRKLYSILKP